MSLTANVALAQATQRLLEAGVPDAARDARRLLSHAVGVEPGRLTLLLSEPVDADALASFRGLVDLRAERRPVSHLIGHRSFYGRDFLVTPDVLDPRPETEILIEAALAVPFGHVLDLGTGSGCILLTLLAEMPDAEGAGVDISPLAIGVTEANARALGLEGRCHALVSDWVSEVEGVFDLIVANPPYISRAEMEDLEPEVRDFEPRLALTDEADGLACYRAIFSSIGPHLSETGRVIVEIGPDQADDVTAIAAIRGFDVIAVIPDLDGRDRVIVAGWSDIPF
jgi:release factor glutamine methyltransferase